jgi:hypothetical protein
VVAPTTTTTDDDDDDDRRPQGAEDDPPKPLDTDHSSQQVSTSYRIGSCISRTFFPLITIFETPGEKSARPMAAHDPAGSWVPPWV